MKDVLGNELQPGDLVGYAATSGHTGILNIGLVHKISPKSLSINRYTRWGSSRGQAYPHKTIRITANNIEDEKIIEWLTKTRKELFEKLTA